MKCALEGCMNRVFVDGSTTHDFCGQKHRAEAHRQGVKVAVRKRQVVPQATRCKLTGCPNAAAPDAKGGFFQFCSRDHERRHGLGRAVCAFAQCSNSVHVDQTSGKASLFCSRKHKDAAAAALAAKSPLDDGTTCLLPECDKPRAPATSSSTTTTTPTSTSTTTTTTTNATTGTVFHSYCGKSCAKKGALRKILPEKLLRPFR